MKAYRTILAAASLAATAACGGSEDPNRVVADNVEFLPEEALLNDVAGRAEADNAHAGKGEDAAAAPAPAAVAPERPSPPPPPRPKTAPPKTVPDARPIIDPPPPEQPDIHAGHDMDNMSNGQ
jgi:hypothetical protein